jgi:hypothetical protein
MERVVQIEQNGAIAREAIREQHLACAELVLGVVRPDALFADGRRGDDGAVPVAVRRQVEDGELRPRRAKLPKRTAGCDYSRRHPPTDFTARD